MTLGTNDERPRETGPLLLAIGPLCLGVLAADQVGHATRVPRVAAILLIGLVVGEAGLDLVPPTPTAWFDTLSIVALTMVAFLLGGALTAGNLRRHRRAILIVSRAIVAATIGFVFAGPTWVGLDPAVALVLATIATATAPAAVTDVIEQPGISTGFTAALTGIAFLIGDASIWLHVSFLIASTVLFELFAPPGTALAIRRGAG